MSPIRTIKTRNLNVSDGEVVDKVLDGRCRSLPSTKNSGSALATQRFFITGPEEIFEYQTYTYTVTAYPSIPDGTKLYYSLRGVGPNASGVNSSDWIIPNYNNVPAAFPFEITFNNNTATFNLQAANADGEENESFVIVIRDDFLGQFTVGKPLATSKPITIKDTVSGVFFGTPYDSDTSISEGQSYSVPVSLIGYPDGTYYYSIDPGPNNTGSLDPSEFASTFLTGSFVVSGAGGTIDLEPLADGVTESNDTIVINVRQSSISGTIIGTTGEITITDATPSGTISPSLSTLAEGTLQEFTFTGTNIIEGQRLYCQIVKTGGAGTCDDSDWSQPAGISNLQFLVTANASGGATIPIEGNINDGNDEFDFKVVVRSSSHTGTIIAETGNITLTDTTATIVEFTGLTWYCASAITSNLRCPPGWHIYIYHSSGVNSNSFNMLSGETKHLVYQNSATTYLTELRTTGDKYFAFGGGNGSGTKETKFTWNETNDVIVESCFSQNGGYESKGQMRQYTVSGGSRFRGSRTDGAGNSCGTTPGTATLLYAPSVKFGRSDGGRHEVGWTSTATSGNTALMPFNVYYKRNICQVIYRASELAAGYYA